MNSAIDSRKLKSSLTDLSLTLTITLGVAAVTVALASVGSFKIFAAALAGAFCILAAFISGNPRLYCLWGLMLTITVDLSHRFGPYIMKLGGESSFRIELSDVCWLALLAFLARDIWTGRRSGLRIPKVTFIWFVIMLIGFGSILFGDGEWPLSASHELIRMAKVITLFIVVCNELERPRGFLHCAGGLVFALIVQSALGLVQYFLHAHLGLVAFGEPDTGTLNDLMATSVRSENVYRVGALMIHPNNFGIFLAVVLPLAIALFLVNVGKTYKLLCFSGIILGTPALIATLSRSSWASFAVSGPLLMLLFFLHRRLRRRVVLPAIVAAAGLATVLVFYSGPIYQRIFESVESSELNRAEFKEEAKLMIAEKPWLGWGLNSYALAVRPYTKYSAWGAREFFGGWVPVVHHIYYLWWAETGMIGLALHLLVLISILWASIGNLRVKNEIAFAVNAGCLSGVMAFVVDGFNDPALRNNEMLRVFWVIGGMIMAVRYWRLQHEAVEDSSQRGFLARWPRPGAMVTDSHEIPAASAAYAVKMDLTAGGDETGRLS